MYCHWTVENSLIFRHSNDAHFGFCLWKKGKILPINIFYCIPWPHKHPFGHKNYIHIWSRSYNICEYHENYFQVWMWRLFWKMTFFFNFWTLFQRGPWSNIFRGRKIYKIKPRTLICKTWPWFFSKNSPRTIRNFGNIIIICML